MGVKMAWSDYINTKSAKLTEAQAGIEILIMAINERSAPFGIEPLEIKKLTSVDYSYYIGGGRATLMEHVDIAMNSLCSRYLKASVVADLSTIEIGSYDSNNTGLYGVHSNSRWNNITEVCEHLGEEEIYWFSPLNTKYPALWLEQRIRIINLLTVGYYASGCPCYIVANKQKRGGWAYNEIKYVYSHEQLLDVALNCSHSHPSSLHPKVACGSSNEDNNGIGIYSYCEKRYRHGNYYHTRRSGGKSSRNRFYNSGSIVSHSYDIIIAAQGRTAHVSHPDSPPIYDAGSSGWIENQTFELTRYRAENGVAEKTDWFGFIDYFPQPVPDPGFTPELYFENTNIRGFQLACCAVIDYAVSGGFEFVEENNT